MTSIADLEKRAEIAYAKLGVAEDLGWIIAILASCVVHMYWDNWLLTIASFIAAYTLAIYQYRKEEKAADDDHKREVDKYYSELRSRNNTSPQD